MSENIIREGYISDSITPVSLEGTNSILNQMKFSVCKIHKIGINGTGFFCNLPYKSKLIPFLITNNHILDSKDIEINKDIKISINNGKEFKNIKIDRKRIILTNEKLDYTLIEIDPKKDNIDTINILKIDEDINIEEQFLNAKYAQKSVYTIQYPKDEEIVVSYGLLSKINEKEIYHLCSTENGASGGPILSLKNFKVIGIHYGFEKKLKVNLGIFIKYVITELSNYLNNKKINLEDNNLQNKFNENNNIYQPKINNNKFSENLNNNIIMIENDNINFKNNKEEIQIKIISKTDYSLSIQAFPNENDFINIIFKNDLGYTTNIIIPPKKHISELFNIYAKLHEINNIDFIFNGLKINKFDQREISQVFNNISFISVITY